MRVSFLVLQPDPWAQTWASDLAAASATAHVEHML